MSFYSTSNRANFNILLGNTVKNAFQDYVKEAPGSSQGNILVVDQVYGEDALARLNPAKVPFKTITAALSLVSSGQTVFIRPGVYNESSLIVPNGVAIRGANTQTVIIQNLLATTSTTHLRLGTSCRVEDVTLTITSNTENITIIGVDCPSNTSVTSKLRTLVVNASYIGNGATNVYALYSGGSSSLNYSSADLCRSITLNASSNGTGITRAVYVTGDNIVSVRDTNVNASGTGTNIIGVETLNNSAQALIKASTVRGILSDVSRTLGSIIIGSTDLVNNSANTHSFTPTQAPANFQYGIIGNLGTSRRYYLVPGTNTIGNINNEPKTNPYNSTLSFSLPFTQPSIIISIIISLTNALSAGEAVTLYVYKDNVSTPVLSLTLSDTDATTYKSLTTSSYTFQAGDTLQVTMETTGDPASGTFCAIIGYY